MKLPDHLSVSQLNTFLSCPLAYRFRYIDRIETGTKSSSFALGTAFHSAAERLHKDIIAGQAAAADDYCTAFDDALPVEFGCFNVQLKPGKSADSLHQEGRALVELYREHRLRQPGKLVAAELRIEQRLVNPATREELGVPFVAYLDLVERDSGGPSSTLIGNPVKIRTRSTVAIPPWQTTLTVSQLPRLSGRSRSITASCLSPFAREREVNQMPLSIQLPPSSMPCSVRGLSELPSTYT